MVKLGDGGKKIKKLLCLRIVKLSGVAVNTGGIMLALAIHGRSNYTQLLPVSEADVVLLTGTPIHHLYNLYRLLFAGSRGARANLFWARDRVHLGQVASSSQG